MSRLRTVFIASMFMAAPASGEIFFFTNQIDFQQFNTLEGKTLKGIETFEESTIDPMGKAAFPNSLCPGVPRPFFPNGIDEPNLCIQTNITDGPCPPVPNPSANQNALFVSGPGFIGSNSVKVGSDEFLNNLNSSLDLIFTPADHTGVGVDVSRYQGFGDAGFIMCVYDPFENILGTFAMPGPLPVEPAKVFFGVWSSIPIGRLNIWDSGGVPSPFAVDNIEMWVPTPGAAALLGLGGLISTGNRRRRA